MPLSISRYIARISLLALSLGLGVTMPPALQSAGLLPGYSLAHADDDDGGDDGDDGGDDDGGSRGGGGGRDGGDGRDDDFKPRGDLRSLFRWPFRQAERPAPRRQAVSVPDRAPNEIVAVGLSEQSIAALLQDGFAIGSRTPMALTGGELVRLTIPSGMTLAAARQAVTVEAPAASVDFNHYYQPNQQPAQQPAVPDCADKGCTLMRHMVGWPGSGPDIEADTDARGENAACAAPQPIGLIDTAINGDHASLKGADIEVIRLGEDKDQPSTKQHGTAVAALLVGAPSSRAPGLLPSARLVAIDAFRHYRGAADIANAYDLVRALDMLVARDIRIINLSLSGPSNLLLEKAVQASVERGAILIAAAGNEGPSARPVFPAAYPQVIAVTAIDKSRKPYRRAVRGDHIDIAAPGVGVWTAASISGARPQNGTSFAAPFVTAAASVLLGRDPGMDGRKVEEVLMQSADDMGDPGKDKIYGWGLLNMTTLCGGSGTQMSSGG